MQIKANGIELDYVEHGPISGVPLILIRGLGSQAVYWPDELIEGFAEQGYRTIIFDNRDVGLSSRCPRADVTGNADDIRAALARGETITAAYSLEDMALDVIGLMDGLSIEKAHVFGISMGGGITQLLACYHSNRLLSATIVMSAAKLSNLALLERLLVNPENRIEFQESYVQGNNDWGSPGFAPADDWLREKAGIAWDRGNEAEGVNRQALATVLSSDWKEALKEIRFPCFVIHGQQDTLIPPEAGKEIAALIPNSRLELIDGMGHVITPLLSPIIIKMVVDFIQTSSEEKSA